jgi:hypothetical protein
LAESVLAILTVAGERSRMWKRGIGAMLVVALVLCSTGAVSGQSGSEAPESIGAATERQKAWLAASLQDRVKLAEGIGDEGARAMAREKGYQTLFDGLDRLLPQGPDQVYRAQDGRVIVVEAKGGTGELSRAYGFTQGTSEWAVESAKRVLQSSRASAAERAAAAEVLRAASGGCLEVQVIRTRHVLGEPVAAVLERSSRVTDQAISLAREALLDLERVGAGAARQTGQAVDDVARTVAATSEAGESIVVSKALPAASKALLVGGALADAGLRGYEAYGVEKRYQRGEIDDRERVIAHAKNGAGMAGGWCGALAFGSQGAAWGSVLGPGGAAVGGVAGGIGGYLGGEKLAKEAVELGSDIVYGGVEAARSGVTWLRSRVTSLVRGSGR